MVKITTNTTTPPYVSKAQTATVTPGVAMQTAGNGLKRTTGRGAAMTLPRG
jgi:hypothetical protein